MHEQNIICSKIRLEGITPEQVIICRSRGSFAAFEKEEKMPRMIVVFADLLNAAFLFLITIHHYWHTKKTRTWEIIK